MALLYIDEDLSREFVHLLAAGGHDVVYAVDSSPRARTDAWHLQRASVDRRILITFNERDYRFLHRLLTTLWVFQAFRGRHAGILTATAQLEPSTWVPMLQRLLDTEPQLSGRMLVWHQSKQEWREDDWRPEE